MNAVKEYANAKINLYLDVVAKREDGFHDIKTVMHSISLSDEITVTLTPAKNREVRIKLEGGRFLPTDSRNLAVKAALLYLERAGVNARVDIKMKKNIPVAAGLAGGSSDAAAVLRAMNKLHSRLFTDRALTAIAAELGSDVPYCLYGKTALCEGRGEIMTRLSTPLTLHLVVAIANEHVSTPKAYAALDEIYSNFDGSIPSGGDGCYDRLLSSIEKGELLDGALFNVFEAATLPRCKGASKIKVRLLELGAAAALMSGSGPSVFGVFNTKSEAETAKEQLISEGFTAHYAISV